MATSDPLVNETFSEEVEALLNHATFLRGQIQRSREKLQSLEKMNVTNDQINENINITRLLLVELVNIIKDLDETTAKIVTILGLPVLEIDNIELSQYDTEKHGLSPIPNRGIGILNKVPKILSPFPEIISFGYDENIGETPKSEEYTKQKSNVSERSQIDMKPSKQSPKSEVNEEFPADSLTADYKEMSSDDEKNMLFNIMERELNKLNSINADISSDGTNRKQNIMNDLEKENSIQGKSKQPTSTVEEAKECYKQLAVKDEILKNLRDKLRQRQRKLKILNAKNEELNHYVMESEPKTDKELTNSEFVEKYMERLKNKMKRIEELEKLRKKAEDERVNKIIKKRLNYIMKLEKSNESYAQNIQNSKNRENKAIPDILNDYLDMSSFQIAETIKKIKHTGDTENEEHKDMYEATSDRSDDDNNGDSARINRRQFLKYSSDENITKIYNFVNGNDNGHIDLGRIEGKNYHRQALGKCCKVEEHPVRDSTTAVDPYKDRAWTGADALQAIQRMGASDWEQRQVEELLRKIEDRQDAIEKIEMQIKDLKSLTDSEELVQIGHKNVNQKGHLIAEKRDTNGLPHTTNNSSTNGLHARDSTLHLLKTKRDEEWELRNQCRIANFNEAQAQRTLAVLEDELAKRKSQRLLINGQMSQLKDQIAERNSIYARRSDMDALKDKLREITSGVKQKREEFEDKKKLVEKLDERIEQLERTLTKRTLC